MIATFRPLSPANFPLSGKIGPDLSRFPGTDSRASSAFRDLSPRLRPLSAPFFPDLSRFPRTDSQTLPAFRTFFLGICPLSGSFGKWQKAISLDQPPALEHDNTMKEHPILFSGPLVRAILDGRKTQTRRLLRVQPGSDVATFDNDGEGGRWHSCSNPGRIGSTFPGATDPDRIGYWRDPVGIRCPYGQPGDRLWVRESWRSVGWRPENGHWIEYAADNAKVWREAPKDVLSVDVYNHAHPDRWRPSIHMPRWASRISLEVTEVRVQRIQEITEEDARAEGVPAIPRLDGSDPRYYRQSFAALWDSLAPAGQEWADTPWVWAVTFKRVQG